MLLHLIKINQNILLKILTKLKEYESYIHMLKMTTLPKSRNIPKHINSFISIQIILKLIISYV